MEEEKLTKKKKKALNGSNRRTLAEACNDLASFYYKHNRFNDALDEYKIEASIYKEMGLRLEWGTANRMIGEMYMMLAEFDKALKYEERHLLVARELNSLVEEQRAMATLGRIYLLQGQSSSDKKEAPNSLRSAEKAFMKSLVLCEKLNGKINKHELMDMRARLLLNIGVVQEHLGFVDKALDCIHKAISICVNLDLCKVLHQCYVTEAMLHTNKSKDYAKALSCLNKALETASRLDDKVLKQCETLASKADILCKMSDYQSAKQVLLKAWKLKTPDEEETQLIESNLKVVAAMCYTEDLLISTDPSDHVTFKKLYEKLGDGACHLHNYTGAVDYYLKMLQHAELAGETGKSLIPIYVSLYQTYKDMQCYDDALVYYYKEYQLIKDVPKEAYVTLYNIAEALFLANKPYEEVEQACLDARDAARNCNNTKYEIRILKNLLTYQEEHLETDKMVETKAALRSLGYDDDEKPEDSEDEQSSAGSTDENTPRIGDDICLDALTDLSDNEEEETSGAKREARKRGRSFVVKKNIKGETQLHVAAISGNKLLVERLLAKGHPVNVRDNAGWLPIHEACIHGHLDVANMLIDNGAHVNDRGGSNCDGITPLYDAASNGHLEVVQLLLHKGAIASLKTDFGETALRALQKWRSGTVLDRDEELIYQNICNKINGCIDKTGQAENLNRSKSKTPIKTPPSTSKDYRSPGFKSRNVINDSDEEVASLTKNQEAFPSDDSNDSNCVDRNRRNSHTGVKEYRNAISALRNRNVNDSLGVEVKKTKPKSALLAPEEVDDDWLEDDLGNDNKKRKLSYEYAISKKHCESVKETVDNINRIPLVENEVSKSNISDLVDISDSDSENFQRNQNLNNFTRTKESFRDISAAFTPEKSRDSRDNMRKRWKRQSTLLKSGFQRKRDDCSSNSGSDTEINTKFQTNKSISLSRKPSNENFTEAFNVVSMNANIVQPVNVIHPISIMQSKNGKVTQTQIVPPAAVKVQVEDKVLLISLKLDSINRLQIKWLVEEVQARYYKLTGSRPVFTLMTSDGVFLSEDDPLSLVLATPELKTCVSSWKASPPEDRYMECCSALGIDPSEEIQQAVGRSHTTHRLALGTKTLSQSQIRPLFRALTHQTSITAILISNNNLGDDGMKYLSECICTLKHLQQLDLSNNNLSSTGTRYLLNTFEKIPKSMCQSLEVIDVSSNPISDEGFKDVLKLGQYLRLKSLKINNCNITESAFNDTNKPAMNFDSLEVFDISNNPVKSVILNCIVTTLNPNVVTDLELENLAVFGNVVGFLATFLEGSQEPKLRRFNLSNCKLADGQFMRIYRCLNRAKHLQTVTLKDNSLTFITLKKLLQRQPPVPQLNLQGCKDIFKYSPDSDFHVWLPSIDFGRTTPEINVTPVHRSDEERDTFKVFSKIWLNCFRGRGVIEHCDGGVTRFTAR